MNKLERFLSVALDAPHLALLLLRVIFGGMVLLFVGCGSSGSNNPKSVEGVTIDPRTKLMWQDNLASEVDTMNWSQAIKYCDDLNLANFQDWELPSYGLLATAYKAKSIFSFITSSYYWSSSSYASNSSYAWLVGFSTGHKYYNGKTYSYYVRCVRGRQ